MVLFGNGLHDGVGKPLVQRNNGRRITGKNLVTKSIDLILHQLDGIHILWHSPSEESHHLYLAHIICVHSNSLWLQCEIHKAQRPIQSPRPLVSLQNGQVNVP